MKRIILVHWNANEAEERAARLRAVGYDVSCHADSRANPKTLPHDEAPDAFVIDLSRLPSQGREMGGWLRRQAATRAIPIVFLEGDPDKTGRVRDLLPDATFTSWEAIDADLAAAIAEPPIEPIVPGAMDAYRGVPLAEKLGITPGRTVAWIDAPSEFERLLGPLPDGAEILGKGSEEAEVILWFVGSAKRLEKGFASAVDRMAVGGRLWIAWPKASSGRSADLSQRSVRAFGLARGLVDYKIASIDETWSALCFARRKGG